LYKIPKQEIIKYSFGKKILKDKNIDFIEKSENK